MFPEPPAKNIHRYLNQVLHRNTHTVPYQKWVLLFFCVQQSNLKYFYINVPEVPSYKRLEQFHSTKPNCNQS